VPTLVRKGYVVTEEIGKKTFFIAKNPEYVLALLQKKADLFKTAMPELLAIFNKPDNKPKVSFYQGKEDVQKMYEDTLKEGKTLLNLTSLINLYKYLDREWVDDYIRRRVEAGIETRIIAIDSKESREWEENADKHLREIKLIPNKDYNFSADMHIYGNKIIVTTYKENLFGLIIEDENIASLQRMAFEMMWGAI
jgi:sugar-specific transcriptional regulator TrmB